MNLSNPAAAAPAETMATDEPEDDRQRIAPLTVAPKPPEDADRGTLPALAVPLVPPGASPVAVRVWFDGLMESALPPPDGTLVTARRTADTLARLAKAENTRRAYRAGVRAWCLWCDRHRRRE